VLPLSTRMTSIPLSMTRFKALGSVSRFASMIAAPPLVVEGNDDGCGMPKGRGFHAALRLRCGRASLGSPKTPAHCAKMDGGFSHRIMRQIKCT